jgi:biotin carboxyl carrier protein
VAKGDSVTEGSILLVLDSMKMEHPFRASRDGKVVSLEVKEGSIVQAGSTLLVIG